MQAGALPKSALENVIKTELIPSEVKSN